MIFVNPCDPYAVSKYEAEIIISDACEHSVMEYVIIRPPLVYGPGVKGNFKRLMKLTMSGVPLPFGSISNSRSLVSILNLVSLIHVCLEHDKATNEIFLVSDDNDWSTPALITEIARHTRGFLPVFPLPLKFLRMILTVIRMSSAWDRLSGSLCVDIDKTKALLGWSPPQKTSEAIELTIKYELSQRDAS